MGNETVSYVFIPSDLHEALEERSIEVPQGAEVECLLDVMKAHFRTQGKKTAAQKQRQIEELKSKMNMPQGGGALGNMEQMLNAATDFTMAEPVPLLSNTADTNYVGVNMYVDDSGAIKELPVNMRASQFAACCGVHLQVHGDAYVARFRDDEDTFARLDFHLGELSSSAAWVQAAKAQAVRRQQRGDPQALLQSMHGQQGGQQSGGAQEQKPTSRSAPEIRELTAAEAAKENGNAAFKRGQYQQAVEDYTRALSMDPDLLAARNNRAACFVKLEKWSDALDDCNIVLKAEPDNAKALLRRAAARQHLNQDAREDLEAVLRIQPGNRDAQRMLKEVEDEVGQ